jgi:3-isopropylmalate/(R)-2-methylmalate dehydratase small subunit
MTPFASVESVAAPLPESDIDTDVIFPARFLLLLDRHGLAAYLFHERRRRATDAKPFVLDRAPFNRAEILVTGANFGCGSSREQAVWALADFGVRAIVAPSFGEIFLANCFRNGILPVTLGGEAHGAVMNAAISAKPLTISLERQEIGLPEGETISFAIDPGRRRDLLLGRDEIAAILADDGDEIAAFEQRRRDASPWLVLERERLAALGDLPSDEL